MATSDLKSILHQQIDRLQDPQDVQDLLLTVSEFVSQRTNIFSETPELLTQLEKVLSSSQVTYLTPHDVVAKEAKQWITP
ncbi:hypothetical protein [Spirosoma foliorum]|uniref:Uncharacterized protein n=1 Tax=Spirosoma foliorum TaxID=2710596 RepID=A0A7G5GVJ7_9BACT|nr:hypothetical protein [Spirosoma foliorum]QMW02889.1 hypothetical protein H3H32_34195 [Spirosoma foliorum]